MRDSLAAAAIMMSVLFAALMLSSGDMTTVWVVGLVVLAVHVLLKVAVVVRNSDPGYGDTDDND